MENLEEANKPHGHGRGGSTDTTHFPAVCLSPFWAAVPEYYRQVIYKQWKVICECWEVQDRVPHLVRVFLCCPKADGGRAQGEREGETQRK